MSEHPFDRTVPLNDRRHRNMEQIGTPSQPTPIQPRVLIELEREAVDTATHLLQEMRDGDADVLNGGDRLHALADALGSVTGILCVARTEELEVTEERTY